MHPFISLKDWASTLNFELRLRDVYLLLLGKFVCWHKERVTNTNGINFKPVIKYTERLEGKFLGPRKLQIQNLRSSDSAKSDKWLSIFSVINNFTVT